MAFIGVAVVKLVSTNLVRITGVSLNNLIAGDNSIGTIGLFESTLAPDVVLPDDFKPRPYDLPDTALAVSLQDAIECWFVFTNGGAAYQAIGVEKSGTTPQDFQITLAEPETSEIGESSGDLEIYVRFH